MNSSSFNPVLFLRAIAIAGFLIATGASVTHAESEKSDEGWARVVEVSGEAFLVDPDTGDRTAIRKEQRMRRGDRIITGAESRIVFVFSNGSAVTFGPETDATLTDVADESTEIDLDYGEIFGNIEGLDERSRFSVTTPLGVAGIRGTTFRVIFSPATGLCIVTNVHGNVLWEWRDEPIAIEEGMELYIRFGVDDEGRIEISEVLFRNLSGDEARRIVATLQSAIIERMGIRPPDSIPDPIPFDGTILSPARPVPTVPDLDTAEPQ